MLTIITRTIFAEDMQYSEKVDIAERIMNQLMLRNTYIDLFFPNLNIWNHMCWRNCFIQGEDYLSKISYIGRNFYYCTIFRNNIF